MIVDKVHDDNFSYPCLKDLDDNSKSEPINILLVI